MRDICYVELFLEITFYSFYRHKGVGSSKVFFFLFQSINFFFSLSNLFDIHIEFTQLVKRSEPYSHFCNTDHTREPVFDYTNSQFSPPPPQFTFAYSFEPHAFRLWIFIAYARLALDIQRAQGTCRESTHTNCYFIANLHCPRQLHHPSKILRIYFPPVRIGEEKKNVFDECIKTKGSDVLSKKSREKTVNPVG